MSFRPQCTFLIGLLSKIRYHKNVSDFAAYFGTDVRNVSDSASYTATGTCRIDNFILHPKRSDFLTMAHIGLPWSWNRNA